MRLILTTCSRARAESLLLELLEERLVGCGNLVDGVVSHYWWNGRIERDDEVLLLMETAAECAERATARLRELHPYEVPKIVVLAPESAGASYVEWLRGVTGRGAARADDPSEGAG